jgi:hypothetical protein
VQQVNKTVTEMDKVVQQNAAAVQQSASAAEAMRRQAEALVQAVSAFRVSDAGSKVAAPAPLDVPPPAPVLTRPKASPTLTAGKPARAAAGAAMALATTEEWEEF